MGSDGEFASKVMKFESVLQANVPKGRDGKHKEIITQLLSDIAQLAPGSAVGVEQGCPAAEDQSGYV